jgi:hypothetical protein
MEPTLVTTQPLPSVPMVLSTEAVLLEQLLIAKINDEEWQEVTGRLVSQIHIKTLKSDISDLEFLHSISLISKAQQAGCKAARKKSISLVRFKDRAPHDFSFSQDVVEQKAQIILLSKIQAPWCIDFISDHISGALLDNAVLPILIKWASKCALKPSTFWNSTLVPILTSAIDTKTKIASLKDFEKSSIHFITQSSSDQALAEFYELFQAISLVLVSLSENKKLSSALIASAIVYVEALRDAIPASILDGVFVAAITDFTRSLSTKEQVKEWAHNREKMSIAAASLLNSITKSLGPTAAEFWKNHMPNLSRAYPSVQLNLKSYVAENTFISLLLGVNTLQVISPNAKYESEVNITLLLQAWQNFRNTYREIDETESLDLLITRVAKSLGIEYFGEVGRTYVYDPIEHNLLDHVTSKSNVSILHQGIQLIRVDGSKKILHPAIVK